MGGSSLTAPPSLVLRIAFKSPSSRDAFRELCSDLQLKSSSSPGEEAPLAEQEKLKAKRIRERRAEAEKKRRRRTVDELKRLQTQETPLTDQDKLKLEKAEKIRERRAKAEKKRGRRTADELKRLQTQETPLTDQEKLKLENAEKIRERRNGRQRNSKRKTAELWRLQTPGTPHTDQERLTLEKADTVGEPQFVSARKKRHAAKSESRVTAMALQNTMGALAEPECECFEFEAVDSSDKISAIVMSRYSGGENATERQRLEQSQHVLIHRLAAFWRLQGVNVTRIYSCIRFRRSRDRIKEEFLDDFGNDDELRLYNTLINNLGSRVYVIQRGLDGITDKASLTSWLRY